MNTNKNYYEIVFIGGLMDGMFQMRETLPQIIEYDDDGTKYVPISNFGGQDRYDVYVPEEDLNHPEEVVEKLLLHYIMYGVSW